MRKKILMVCLGNICRSPIAEGIMQAKLLNYGIDDIVDSAGILSYHIGCAPDDRAIGIARKYKVNIDNQLARQLKPADFENFDFIFAMDRSVLESVLKAAQGPKQSGKVHLFLGYAGYSGQADVPDPYYEGGVAFDRVFNLIDDACERIIRKWYPEVLK